MDKSLEQLDSMSKVLEDLSAKQEMLDKKTKDAEEYRQLNNKLVHTLSTLFVIFGIIIITLVVSSSLLLNSVIDKYLDSNNMITTTTTDLTTGSDSVLLNDISGSDISNISN